MMPRRLKARMRAEQQGRDGEMLAAYFLAQNGYQILARRVRTPVGEIDLIARQDGIIVFAEVKWRARRCDLDHAIDHLRLARVAAAAECIAHDYAKAGEDVRIDVILLAPGIIPRHITNAWQP